jgi:hypothetical protein
VSEPSSRQQVQPACRTDRVWCGGSWDPAKSRFGLHGDIKASRVLALENQIRQQTLKRLPSQVPPSVYLKTLLAARDHGGLQPPLIPRGLVRCWLRGLTEEAAGGHPNYGKTAVKGVLVQFRHIGTISVVSPCNPSARGRLVVTAPLASWGGADTLWF